MITLYFVHSDTDPVVKCLTYERAEKMVGFLYQYRHSKTVALIPTEVNEVEDQHVYVWLPYLDHEEKENPFCNQELVTGARVYDLVRLGQHNYGKFDYNGKAVLVRQSMRWAAWRVVGGEFLDLPGLVETMKTLAEK